MKFWALRPKWKDSTGHTWPAGRMLCMPAIHDGSVSEPYQLQVSILGRVPVVEKQCTMAHKLCHPLIPWYGIGDFELARFKRKFCRRFLRPVRGHQSQSVDMCPFCIDFRMHNKQHSGEREGESSLPIPLHNQKQDLLLVHLWLQPHHRI